MLARPEIYRCFECGLAFGADGFSHYHGKVEDGPAYWSDQGVLCSPACSLAHTRRRAAEGTLPERPSEDPRFYR